MSLLRVSKNNQTLYLQRNTLLLISILLLISNVLLSVFVFSKQEKTIIIPTLKEEISLVGKEEFSESYIEQMTIFFIDLLLNLTPDNIGYKSGVLLKYVESGNYHNMEKYYKEEGDRYKKYRVATKFDLTGIRVKDRGRKVEIDGVFSSRFGEGSNVQKNVGYEMVYKKSAGKLLIVEFKQRGEHVE